MSDTNTDADDEILEYKCRKCPGKTFTAAEKDAHRMFHRTQKEKDKKKPGPKSRTRDTRRDASPAPSGVTLFETINNESTSNKRTDRRNRLSGLAPRNTTATRSR
ncbi:hypothetical protein Ocin01_12423 [Orchesella cincta]|uniref:Uncharacterized protein n=1 Tax=Orchesella cincta TaxID=48709 RepID=A0A1D2MMJ9_ORCCI|nr:hypothetical protein Ocin01_12423 [Orchesella cincta]